MTLIFHFWEFLVLKAKLTRSEFEKLHSLDALSCCKKQLGTFFEDGVNVALFYKTLKTIQEKIELEKQEKDFF